MNYALQINGPSEKLTVPLTQDLYRIGNDKKCEIRIPCRSAHALTVFRRKDSVFVLNRSKHSLTLGKLLLDTEATAEWRPGTGILVEGTDLRLQVLQTRPKADERQPLALSNLSDSDGSAARNGGKSNSALKPKKKNQTSQMIIIGTCMLMIAGMQLAGRNLKTGEEEMDDKLVLEMKALQGFANSPGLTQEAKSRAEYLVDVLARYRLLVCVENGQNSLPARADAKRFCDSIASTPSQQISAEERGLAARLGALLATR